MGQRRGNDDSMTPPADDGPRYASLRDYLWVVRFRWYVILVMTALFAAVALAISLRQPTMYTASASVQYTDPAQGEDELLGVPSANPTLPAQLAENAEATLGQPNVANAARRVLKLSGHAKLPGSASSFIDPTTGYLVIQAQSRSAVDAALLANALGQAEVKLGASTARVQYAQLAKVALREERSLTVNDEVTREVYEDRYVRLSYLAQTASPAAVITPAGVPSGPSSPHPVTDTLLGLVVGLTLGILAAFLVDALDRRLRHRKDITEELGWPILGHIREETLGRVPFLDLKGDSHSGLDREAFHILRRNVQLMDVDGKTKMIAVTSALPEEGKSTVAASLAYASALAGKTTLLVECDLRRPALADRLGRSASPGLIDYLRGEASPSEVVQAVAVIPSTSANGAAKGNGSSAPTLDADVRRPPESVLAFIPAGRSAIHPAELLSSDRFHNFLKDIAASYEMIVVDTAPLLPVADTLELIPDVDAILVCLRASRTTRDGAQALKQAMERLRNPHVGLVITGAPRGTAHEFGYYAYDYGYAYGS